KFFSAVVMFEVVLFFAVSRSLAESCGEICGGAGLGGAGSAASGCGGRGRGAAGRLAGAGVGTGAGVSGCGSAVGCSGGGGVVGGGVGAISTGGGGLPEGGAALTIGLFAHPAIPRAAAHSSTRSAVLRIMFSAPRLFSDRVGERGRAPFDAPVATRFETSCHVRLPT